MEYNVFSVAAGVKIRIEERNKNQKNIRLTIFDNIRNIPKCESPVPKTGPKLKLKDRMNLLKKWKEEKQKKKMEAAAKKKKPFVVGIVHNTLKFVPPPPPKPMPSTSGGVTGSQTTINNIEKVKRTKSTKSEPHSFAPKDAKFNPALNHLVKLPLLLPDTSDTKKGPSKLNLDRKEKVKSKTNENVKKNKVSSKNFVSESSSSVDSNTMSAVQKQKTTKKSIGIKKLYIPKNYVPKSEPDSEDNENVKKNKVSSKNLAVPKSEPDSEEKLRSPRLPADVSMIPEQIVEVVQMLPSACVIESREKDNARKGMKKKIDEGLLYGDFCELASLNTLKQQLDSEIKRMKEKCNMWEKISEQVVLPEAVQEAVLGAVGQARLLMSQKLQQFATLLARAEQPEPGAALVTLTDLHGFWDMVFIQVKNIDMHFKKLEDMRARNWAAETLPRPAPRVARPARAPHRATARSATAPASRLRDVIAAKRKEKQAQNQEGPTPEITETKTFEAGFFTVRSPVRARSPAGRDSTTPRRSLLHAVLSSEAKRASTSKKNTSFAMVRASLIGKNVDNDESLFSSNPMPLTPVNLCATPARSIIKSVNSKSTRKSGSTEADMQNTSTFEKLDLEGENTKEEKSKKMKDSMKVEKGVMDDRHK